MRYFALWAAVAAFASGFAATPAMAQQGPAMSPGDVAKIKADVVELMHTYNTLFSARDAKGVAEKVFAPTSVAITPTGVTVSTTQEVMQRYEKTLKAMVETGWDKSLMAKPVVCILTPTTAMVGGKFQRFRKDGSVMYEGGETLLVGKFPEGWRVVSLLGQPPTKLVTCND